MVQAVLNVQGSLSKRFMRALFYGKPISFIVCDYSDLLTYSSAAEIKQLIILVLPKSDRYTA
jgi:hypothetical protein